MPAPLHNQFWKNRSKHGREKLFATPILLWQAAEQYFSTCDDHPWYQHDYVGKDAGEVWREKMIPYTLSGFCLFIGASENYWREFKKGENLSKDFLEVIDRIEMVIKTQKMVGATVGAFNANIISRDLGLVDKQALTGEGGGPIQIESKVTQHTVVFKKFNVEKTDPPNGDNPDVQ